MRLSGDPSAISLPSTNTVEGGLDISTGVFSSPHPGSYTISWSLDVQDDVDDHYLELYLRKNSENIIESRINSQYTGPSGRIHDQGELYNN